MGGRRRLRRPGKDVPDSPPHRFGVPASAADTVTGRAQMAWHGNDLNDVIALSVAVPYCDVVVTERSWSSMLAAVKVPQRYDTLVTPSPQDVVDRLA